MIQGILNQVMLTWRLLFDPRVPAWKKAVALAPLIYVLSPFDFIPDFLLGFGQLDDIGLVLAGMRLFESLVPEDIVREHRSAIAEGRTETVSTPPSNGNSRYEREQIR